MPPPHSPDRGRDDRNRQTWQDPRTLPYSNNYDGRSLPSSGNNPGPSGSVWGQPSNPYFSNPGNPGSSSRRSRSPEGDRMRAGGNSRANYRSVDNYYPQSEHGEPGQILSPSLSHNPISIPFSTTSNNPLPRDPRASASVPTGPSSYRPIPTAIHNQPPTTQYRPRKPSSDRPNDGGRSPLPGGPASMSSRDSLAPSSGSVMNALENFSKAMHSALITTSQHALAFKHFSRLTTSNVVNQHSPTYEEAEKRVSKAQKVVDEQMIALQSSFTELIRRTIGTTGTSSDAISALELDALKERMRKIEDMTSKASRPLVPPPPTTTEAPPPPPAPAAAEDGSDRPPSRPPTPSFPPPAAATTSSSTSNRPISTEEKKRRVKDVLDDIITRLEKVEDIKNEFDSRIDEIETVQMTNEEEYMDRESRRAQLRRYSGWGGLEARRDPQGTIRGLKRKERENDDEVQDGHPATPGGRAIGEGDEDVIMGSNGGEGSQLVENLQKDVERLSDEVKILKTQLASKSPLESFPLLAGPTAAALEQITNHLNSQRRALTGLASSNQTNSEAPPLLSTAPLSPATSTSLGNMMNQLNTQRQALASQSTGQVDANQLKEIKSEMVKLSQQMAALQSIAQNTTKSNGIPTSTTVDGVQAQPQSTSQSEILSLQNTINSIQSVIDKLTTDIQTLSSDKTSRLGIFEKIQIGVSTLAENIQKCRNDYTHLNDLSRASSATIISHTERLKAVSGDIDFIKNEIKSIRQHPTDSVADKDKEILELKANIAELKHSLKEMREGREEWTKEVMKACLDSVKEENESRKEDYAKIARREIQNTVKDFMTKRSATTSTTSAAAGGPASTSSGSHAQSQLNRSISEPTDNTNTNNNLTNSISPSIQPPINPSPALQGNLIPPGIPHQNSTPSPLSQNTQLGTNASQGQGQSAAINPLAARIQTISPQPAHPKPTLSDRMNPSPANPIVAPQNDQLETQPHVSHPLRDRLTGGKSNEHNGGGNDANNMDIDRN